MASRTAVFIAKWRRRALAYKYDFNTNANERIIADVRRAISDRLEAADGRHRAAARTIAHYLAQLALRPRWSKWLFELAALPALPLYLVYASLKGILKHAHTVEAIDGVQLVFPGRFEINPEIFCIPDELVGARIATKPLESGFLHTQDIWGVLHLLVSALRLRAPFPAQLALKCAVDLSKVRGALNGLAPKWIIVYWEFSCALSFVSGALRGDKIATYNVMHGDKNFYAKNAFFEVDRCYCWDSYYAGLFRKESVRAEFRIFQNPAFKMSAADVLCEAVRRPSTIGLTVPDLEMLSADSREAAHLMKKIAEACNTLAANYDVSVRPHPLYVENFLRLRPFLQDSVEVVTAEDENARAFILRHALLIGTNSTVLLEAAHLGRKVILLSAPTTTRQDRHHYLYSHPNVVTCSIDALTTTARETLSQSPPDRFRQPRKTGTYPEGHRIEQEASLAPPAN